jgi:hypothetical protein
MGKEGAKSAEINKSLTYERLLPTEKKQKNSLHWRRQEGQHLSFINMT